MLKLFYSPNACSLAPHIALAESGAAYEAVRVDLKAGEQKKPDYLAINPKGRVPALMTEKGVLTENPVILNWIAENFPTAQLRPDDAFAYAQMQSFNLYLASTIHVTFAHLFRTERWADSEAARTELKAKVPSSLAALWTLIEDCLGDGRPWVCGERYTVADPYLYVFARWLERDGVGSSADMPLTRAHRARMQERPAVKKVLAKEDLAPV
ncbi:MAG TPA: glutathione S-transferase N-terminal domain-containing protein [Rhizomicrobium sp.]|jgi:glutathione S-transferase